MSNAGSMRTQALATRLEHPDADAVKRYAVEQNLTISSAMAQLVRQAMSSNTVASASR